MAAGAMDGLILVGQRRHGSGGRRDGRSQHRNDVLLACQTVERIGRFDDVALVVHGFKLDLLAENAAVLVDFLDRKLEAADFGFAIGGGCTGIGGDRSDGDHIVVRDAAAVVA